MPWLAGNFPATSERMSSCIFCAIAARTAPAHRIYEDDSFVAFLDIYPILPGHTLVIPREHHQFLSGQSDAAAGALFAMGARIGRAIRASELACDDLNYVLNDGPAANQTVAHAHLHLVPRVRGDLRSLARMLLQRPVQTWLGEAPSGRLAEQATIIRRAL